MRCVICLLLKKPKNIINPNCRCTVKQSVCRYCYHSSVQKLNLECAMCRSKATPDPDPDPVVTGGAQPLFSIYPTRNTFGQDLFSIRALEYIIRRSIDPLLIYLLRSNSMMGIVMYLILSILCTITIIIPYLLLAALEYQCRNMPHQDTSILI